MVPKCARQTSHCACACMHSHFLDSSSSAPQQLTLGQRKLAPLPNADYLSCPRLANTNIPLTITTGLTKLTVYIAPYHSMVNLKFSI